MKINNSEYIEGLKKAIELINLSHEIDCCEMIKNDQIYGAKRSSSQSILLIRDEIEQITKI